MTFELSRRDAIKTAVGAALTPEAQLGLIPNLGPLASMAAPSIEVAKPVLSLDIFPLEPTAFLGSPIDPRMISPATMGEFPSEFHDYPNEQDADVTREVYQNSVTEMLRGNPANYLDLFEFEVTKYLKLSMARLAGFDAAPKPDGFSKKLRSAVDFRRGMPRWILERMRYSFARLDETERSTLPLTSTHTSKSPLRIDLAIEEILANTSLSPGSFQRRAIHMLDTIRKTPNGAVAEKPKTNKKFRLMLTTGPTLPSELDNEFDQRVTAALFESFNSADVIETELLEGTGVSRRALQQLVWPNLDRPYHIEDLLFASPPSRLDMLEAYLKQQSRERIPRALEFLAAKAERTPVFATRPEPLSAQQRADICRVLLKGAEERVSICGVRCRASLANNSEPPDIRKSEFFERKATELRGQRWWFNQLSEAEKKELLFRVTHEGFEPPSSYTECVKQSQSYADLVKPPTTLQT